MREDVCGFSRTCAYNHTHAYGRQRTTRHNEMFQPDSSLNNKEPTAVKNPLSWFLVFIYLASFSVSADVPIYSQKVLLLNHRPTEWYPKTLEGHQVASSQMSFCISVVEPVSDRKYLFLLRRSIFQ